MDAIPDKSYTHNHSDTSTRDMKTPTSVELSCDDSTLYIPGNSGIINSGNTCYMNASIQAISHIYVLRQYLFNNESKIIDTILGNAPSIFANTDNFNNDIVKKIMQKNYHPLMLTNEEKTIIVNSTMTYQVLKLLKGLWNDNSLNHPHIKKNAIINPVSFRKIFSEARDKFFFGHNQHDAEEAYNCIIQKMHEELATKNNSKFNTSKSSVIDLLSFKNETVANIQNSKTEKEQIDFLQKYDDKKKSMPEEQLILESFREMKKYYDVSHSIITDNFAGFLHSSISCPDIGCNFVSNKFEPFLHLSLSIPIGENITIYDCMNEYHKEEILDDNNLWKCINCKKNVKAIKKMNLWTNPTNLVIQLKRFDQIRSRKNNNIIFCPTTNLDIESMMSPINMKSMCGKCYVYDLQCVINHSGNMGGGHYFTYCKDYYTNKWYKYDDCNVTEISSSLIITQMAYILFYIRRDMFIDK